MAQRRRRSRYRTYNGRVCIDLNLRHINQLFDSRDPSPFLERDLDDNAVDYIISAIQEHSLSTPVALIVHISEPDKFVLESNTVVEAIHNHFAYDAELARKKLSQFLRQGQFALVVGVSVLFTCLTIARSVLGDSEQHIWTALREGLVIMGWVAMWRPIDIFLYSWWPQVETRKMFEKLSRVPVEIKLLPRSQQAA